MNREVFALIAFLFLSLWCLRIHTQLVDAREELINKQAVNFEAVLKNRLMIYDIQKTLDKLPKK